MLQCGQQRSKQRHHSQPQELLPFAQAIFRERGDDQHQHHTAPLYTHAYTTLHHTHTLHAHPYTGLHLLPNATLQSLLFPTDALGPAFYGLGWDLAKGIFKASVGGVSVGGVCLQHSQVSG